MTGNTPSFAQNILRNTNEEQCLQIAHLTFEHQIIIWSLRSCLKGPESAAKVYGQFSRSLPPAAARLAHDSINRLIRLIRRHGQRPFLFNCLCRPAVTEDELAFLALFQAIRDNTPAVITECAESLVCEHGISEIIESSQWLLAALDTRYTRDCRRASPIGQSYAVH